MKTLVVSDGKPGHQNQSLGIAERLPDTKVLLFNHGLSENFSEFVLRWGVGHAGRGLKPDVARRKLLDMTSEKEFSEIVDFAPDLVISAGSTSASVNLLFGACFDIPRICIMRPSLVNMRSFDLVVLPAHDFADDLPNTMRLVITPNRGAPDRAKEMGIQFGEKNKLAVDAKYLGVIIGGKAKGLKFDDTECRSMLRSCYRWAGENDIIVLSTTSRRSGESLETAIEAEFGDDSRTGYMLLAGRDNENPTYAFHGLAGRAVITSDSISMVSEAVYSGVKPVVVDLSGGAVRLGKRGRFYDGLLGGNYIDFVQEPGDLSGVLAKCEPFTGAAVPDELKSCISRIIDIVKIE